MASRGVKDAEAEALFRKWLIQEGYRVYSPPKTRFGTQDMFGAFDVAAFRGNTVVFAQVTTQSGRANRRKKIVEKGPWPEHWDIWLVSHEKVPKPEQRNVKRHYWKIESLCANGWDDPTVEEFDIDALKRVLLRDG